MNNGNILKKRIKENIKREKNKSTTDEKKSSNSSKNYVECQQQKLTLLLKGQ